MPAFRTLAIAAAIAAWSALMVATALSCDNDRYPCNFIEPQPFSGLFSSSDDLVAKKPLPPRNRERTIAARRAPAEKPAAVAAIRGLPEILRDQMHPATDGLRVFASEELSDVDLDAVTREMNALLETNLLELAFDTAAPDTPVRIDRVVSVAATFPRAYELDDQALMNRILLTFVIALAAASAIRIFVR